MLDFGIEIGKYITFLKVDADLNEFASNRRLGGFQSVRSRGRGGGGGSRGRGGG